jgi:hypothetical protein
MQKLIWLKNALVDNVVDLEDLKVDSIELLKAILVLKKTRSQKNN